MRRPAALFPIAFAVWTIMLVPGSSAQVSPTATNRTDASRLTIGLNFTGSTYLVDSGFFPPDTLGAVGESHIVELLNGHYAVYRKSDGLRVQTSSLNQFWIDAGAVPLGSAEDSRVLYDPFSQRWFASSGDFTFNPANPDHLLLGVSNSSDPTAGWTGFSIPFSGPLGTGLDFPTLGVNADGVYLSCICIAPGPWWSCRRMTYLQRRRR